VQAPTAATSNKQQAKATAGAAASSKQQHPWTKHTQTLPFSLFHVKHTTMGDHP